MEKSSQQTEDFATDQYGVVDKESLIYHLYDDAWKSEESDATELQEVPIDYFDNERNGCEDNVSSAITEVSNDFLSGKRTHFCQNKIGESDESHSDSEFKLITGMVYVAHYPETAVGLSDNDWNPYGTESDTNISPRITPYTGPGPRQSDSRFSLLSSFNPPLHSTDYNVNTPSTVMYSIPGSSTDTLSFNEQTEVDTFVLLQPDNTAGFSSMASISEKTVNLYNPLIEDPVRHGDLNKTMSGADLETSSTKSLACAHENAHKNEKITPREKFDQKETHYKHMKEHNILIDNPSNINDEKLMKGLPVHILHDDKIDYSREGMSKKYQFQEGDSFPGREFFGQREQKTVPNIHHFGKLDINRRSHISPVVDYDLLQQDLQDIQDSLQRPRGPEMRLIINGQTNRAEGRSSDSECDIIPSTTATPDSLSNKMTWDFAADLGYQQPGDLMGDISMVTITTKSHRPSDENKSYNSDGDETRTSASSDKIVDHAAADQALAEMYQILYPQIRNHDSINDVDQMVSSFRNQREQIESHDQQLHNQGLAEKISRILNNQDPQSQANGILSEVTDQERKLKAQFDLNPHYKHFNYSTISSHYDESNQSLALPDSVRKRLDLSGLSSTDVSKLTDKSSGYVPVGKGFAASDGVAQFLSSQMTKALERTFNHSMEMIVPQRVVQCYPLSANNEQQHRPRKEKLDEASQAESGSNRLKEEKESENSKEVQERSSNIGAGTGRPVNTISVMTFDTEQSDHNQNSAQSHDDSDSSSGRRREKYRPYRPAGSKDVYYTESDVASVADSVTTMESTHFGSDDARGPALPSSALGSRQDVPNVVGIYGNRKIPIINQDGDNLPPIQEKSGQDEFEAESIHSHKEDKISESLRSQSRGNDGSSYEAERRSDTGIKQADFSIVSREGNMAAFNQKDGVLTGTFAARSIDKWENFKEQIESSIQEAQRSTENADMNHNTRVESFEQTDRKNNQPRQSRIDNFLPTVKQQEDHKSSNQRRRPTNVHVGSVLRAQRERVTDLRNQLTYEDDRDKQEIDHRHSSNHNLNSREERSYSAGNLAPSSSRVYSTTSEKSFRSRFGDAEKPFSPQDPYSMSKRSNPEERPITLPRSHSDEDLYVSEREAQISPLFHRALSPGLRKAIENRSPVLSHHIERSLRQPPVERQDRYIKEVCKDPSSLPTFLARERGQNLREYAAVHKRLPTSVARPNHDRPWSPLLQARVVSPSPSQDHMEQPGQSLNPAERQVMSLRNVSPDSDERESEQSPMSRRAQLLTRVLSQEKEADIQADLGSLWEQFKANHESSESSLNTSSLEAVTDLLLNPSPHLVAQCLKDREDHLIKRQVRAEAEREKRRTEHRQQRHRVPQSSSEEEINIGYAQKEEERMKRRMIRKKKGNSVDAIDTVSEVSTKNIPDSLFSIAEDASFEHSPNKSSSASRTTKSKMSRQPHIIDPNMQKLRERISKQKLKIDKHTLKEYQRVEKLKKLEQLLSAKRNGEISDQTLEMQLDELSSTSTPCSDNSQEDLTKYARSHNTTPLSDDSTTAKDSSTEMHTWKANKEIRIKEMKAKDTAQMDKTKSNKTGKDRNNSLPKSAQEASKKGSEKKSSERDLLKLVKEGYLTAEEAYRLAIEREALSDKRPVQEGSSDDSYVNRNNRLHRQYSPYARDDGLYTLKPHYTPKVKSATSIYDAVVFQRSWYEQDREQTMRNHSSIRDHTENGYIPPKTAQSDANFKERATFLSLPARLDKKEHGRSQSGSMSLRSFSPNRHEKKTSPSRSRLVHNVSPIRTSSFSPGNKNTRKYRTSSKQATSSSVQYEKTCSSENEPPFRKNSSESGGVAWQIPLNSHRSNWKVLPRANKELPLQERKLVTNLPSKKTTERSLLIEDLESIRGWQKENEIHYGIWHKPNHPLGISNEMWEHIVCNDALANKANHWEVDPLKDKVQYIFSKHSVDSGTEDDKFSWKEKPVSKMSLQEALLARKPEFISKCKERQKRFVLACEDRKMQALLRLEREALFLNQDRVPPVNFSAHPYSDNLYQPKRRLFSKQEMKAMTMKRYKKLPEVLQKHESEVRKEQCKLNRLRASIFNRKVQEVVLRKRCMRQR